MSYYNILRTIALLFLVISCAENEKQFFHVSASNISKKLSTNDTLSIEFSSEKFKDVDQVKLKIQDLSFTSTNLSIQIPLSGLKLGKWDTNIQIEVDGFLETKNFEIHLVNAQPPVIYTYEIINTYPHDSKAYTQGLEFFGDTLYESTGQYGQSTLRKLDLPSGKILEKIDLPKQYFGEGLTILDDKIFQLTWREGVGFIYDLSTLEKIDQFDYHTGTEGWGLCNDGEFIYKSDGSEKIWLLNPEDMSVISHIQPTTHKGKSSRLNELEWVDGKIYANTYQKDGVAIIHPISGAVEGIIDLRGLKEKVKQHADLDVLNGIAYHAESNRLFVTGKNWDKLFEIKIIKK